MEEKELKINPMHNGYIKEYKYMLSPRCGAKTRKQTPCLSPAVNGKRRCRMHGGAKGSGAPLGNQNALKHGYNTHKSIVYRRHVKNLLKQWREFKNDHDEG